MIPKRFAVVVQWGQGMIYFNSFSDDEAEIKRIAEGHAAQLRKQQGKRGAKPEITIWEKRFTVID